MGNLKSGKIRISMVIPAYNEAAYLPRLLDTVEKARLRYVGGYESIEIILADNSSTDLTADIARERGCRVVREKKRIIAAVRNCGARAAAGDILVFVDADARVHPETFNAIDRSVSSDRVVGGASGVQMSRKSFGVAATYILLMPLVWLTGMDTGVVFCKRKDFETISGFNEARYYAEDVQFLVDLKRLGLKRGRKLVRLTEVKSIFSTRKFDKHGSWHYFMLIIRFVYSNIFSRKLFDRFARSYWYVKQR